MRNFVKQENEELDNVSAIKVFDTIAERNAWIAPYSSSEAVPQYDEYRGNFSIVKDVGLFIYDRTDPDLSSAYYIYDWFLLVKNSSVSPIGTIKMFYAPINDPDWLLCDGSTFDSTVYPSLYSKLLDNHTPNLVGKTLVGVGTNATLTDNYTLGEIKQNQVQSHSHILGDNGHTHTYTQVAHTHNSFGAINDGYLYGDGYTTHRWSGGNTYYTPANVNTDPGSITLSYSNIGDIYDPNDPTSYEPFIGEEGSFVPNRFAVFYYIKGR